MKRPAPVAAVGSRLACVVDRPTPVTWTAASQLGGATGRKEPTVMSSVPSAAELVHLGMDTSMNEIVAGVLCPGEEMPVVDRIPNDVESVRRLIGRFPDRRVLSACYEAGPGGYELHRLLTSMGVACDVVDPSLAEALALYRGGLDAREAELRAAEARLAAWAGREPLAAPVARLGCYRGIAQLTGLTLAAEVVDWRRFASARAFMGFAGLIPTEYSS